MNEKLLTKIQKMLKLAENAGTQGEAAAAMAMVQRVMVEHKLTRAALDAHEGLVADNAWEACVYTYETKGLPPEALYIASLLETFYGVRCVQYTGSATRIEIFGRGEDVEIAHCLYGALAAAFVRSWKAYLKDGKGAYGDRRSFMFGVWRGFASNMEAQRRILVREQALVVVPDVELDAEFKARYPNLRYTQRRDPQGRDAAMAGHAAGRGVGGKIVLPGSMKILWPARALLA